jgi:hypothetical protein
LWHEKGENIQKVKKEMMRELQSNERDAVLARVEDLPSWVYFPDKERSEWVNKVIKKVWPFFGSYMKTVFKDNIEPIIQASVV